MFRRENVLFGNFFFHHLSAFCIALLLFILIGVKLIYKKVEKKEITSYPAGLFPYLTTNDNSQIAFQKILNTGESICAFGSSELGSGTDARPFIFFPEKLNIPLVAVGHAGNQSFSIFSDLLSGPKDLSDVKIVIFISPGWFVQYSDGTSLQSFLEFVPERFLYYIYFNDSLDRKYKSYFFDYVKRNYSNISSPSAILRLMNYESIKESGGINYATIALPYYITYRYVCFRKKLYKFLSEKNYVEHSFDYPEFKSQNLPISYFTTELKWDSIFSESQKKNIEESKSNSWGIYDEYYTKYVNGAKREINSVDYRTNQETKDFKLLLNYLSYRHARPLFFMQPMNPYVYTNVKELTPTIDSLQKWTEEAGFKFINYWMDDSTTYDKTTLHDVMHLSNYGWYKIDKDIYEYYGEKK